MPPLEASDHFELQLLPLAKESDPASWYLLPLLEKESGDARG